MSSVAARSQLHNAAKMLFIFLKNYIKDLWHGLCGCFSKDNKHTHTHTHWNIPGCIRDSEAFKGYIIICGKQTLIDVTVSTAMKKKMYASSTYDSEGLITLVQ